MDSLLFLFMILLLKSFGDDIDEPLDARVAFPVQEISPETENANRYVRQEIFRQGYSGTTSELYGPKLSLLYRRGITSTK